MVVCFLGDSLVQGIGDAEGLGWVGRLARLSFAADPGEVPARAISRTYYNLGLRGDSSPRLAARWREEALRRRRPGEELALVFSFGAADRNHGVEFGEALEAARVMFAGARELGRTLFVAPPPALDPAWAERNRRLGLGLLEVCAELGLPGLDPFAALAGSPAYMASLARMDGIHPDAAGYGEFAEVVAAWEPMRLLLGLERLWSAAN